jgi:hypothetical protein
MQEQQAFWSDSEHGGLPRETAVRAYRRVQAWERTASARLLDDMRRQGACDPIPLTLHNWGTCGEQEPYKTLARLYNYRQRRIWDEAKRLGDHFARYF